MRGVLVLVLAACSTPPAHGRVSPSVPKLVVESAGGARRRVLRFPLHAPPRAFVATLQSGGLERSAKGRLTSTGDGIVIELDDPVLLGEPPRQRVFVFPRSATSFHAPSSTGDYDAMLSLVTMALPAMLPNEAVGIGARWSYRMGPSTETWRVSAIVDNTITLHGSSTLGTLAGRMTIATTIIDFDQLTVSSAVETSWSWWRENTGKELSGRLRGTISIR